TLFVGSRRLRCGGGDWLPGVAGWTRILPFGAGAAKIRGWGGRLEVQLWRAPRVAVGRDYVLWSGGILCANGVHAGHKHTRAGHTRNEWDEPVRRQCAGKTGAGSYGAYVAGRDRPRIKAKSGAAALERGHSRGARAALGAIKRAAAARDGGAVCGGVETQSGRTG